MRTDISFESRGETCRGWLYLPDGRSPSDRHPAIVMAHGFSAVKEMYLDKFAERFCSDGFAVTVFDFRYLGESSGEPRGQVNPYDQHEDFRNAISWTCQRPEVDPDRIAIWGSSFSGGHALFLSAFDRRIKAAVAQVPAISGWRGALMAGMKPMLQQVLAERANERTARFGSGEVVYRPVVGAPGSPAVLATLDSYEWFPKAAARAPSWINRVDLDSTDAMMGYDPAGPIELISPTPLMIVAAERDSLIPIALVREAFERAGEPKALHVLDCGHFDIYDTEPWYTEAADLEAGWFRQHLM